MTSNQTRGDSVTTWNNVKLMQNYILSTFLRKGVRQVSVKAIRLVSYRAFRQRQCRRAAGQGQNYSQQWGGVPGMKPMRATQTYDSKRLLQPRRLKTRTCATARMYKSRKCQIRSGWWYDNGLCQICVNTESWVKHPCLETAFQEWPQEGPNHWLPDQTELAHWKAAMCCNLQYFWQPHLPGQISVQAFYGTKPEHQAWIWKPIFLWKKRSENLHF